MSQPELPNPAALLTALGTWTTRATDLLYNEGNLLHAVALSAILWPRFIEFEEHVIREDRFDPENFRHWQESTGQNRQAVESVLNHVHIYDLLPSNAEAPLEAYEYLAQVLLRTWKAALGEQHPTRQFEFHYATEPDDYGPTVYVWQTLSGVPS
ncbi:hypothetical protein ACMT4L_00410 [Deinococcus sp. A31D244]|uniref:hypothetical protein n=1 Tax=Deinococcus sp. A31D244 TaxID=3397675 RepID=UPI0039E14D2E